MCELAAVGRGWQWECDRQNSLNNADIAHQAGGKVALLTAEAQAPLAKQADLVLLIPAQTMARVERQAALQLMGSVYEQAEWILLDAIVLRLKDTTGQTADQIRQRHTNLE